MAMAMAMANENLPNLDEAQASGLIRAGYMRAGLYQKSC